MKPLLLLAASALLLPGAASAFSDDPPPQLGLSGGDAWTDRDTAAEMVFGLAMVGDYLQTRQIARQGLEMNPIMGRRGERVKPEIYFPATLILHVATAWALPRPYRNVFQALSITVETGFVGYNLRLGWSIR